MHLEENYGVVARGLGKGCNETGLAPRCSGINIPTREKSKQWLVMNDCWLMAYSASRGRQGLYRVFTFAGKRLDRGMGKSTLLPKRVSQT